MAEQKKEQNFHKTFELMDHLNKTGGSYGRVAVNNIEDHGTTIQTIQKSNSPAIGTFAGSTYTAHEGSKTHTTILPGNSPDSNQPAMGILAGTHVYKVGSIHEENIHAEQKIAQTPALMSNQNEIKVEIKEIQRKVQMKLDELRKNGIDLPVQEFFRTELTKLYHQTSDPDRLATELCSINVLNFYQLEEVRAKSTNTEKNQMIYDYVSKGTEIDDFIVALNNTGNFSILKLIGEELAKTQMKQ